MIDTLDFYVRFWELSSRHTSQGSPLGSSEELELLSLMTLVNADPRRPRYRDVDEATETLAAQLVAEGCIQAVEVLEIQASGIKIEVAAGLDVGARVVLRTADAVSGVAYVLPCKVCKVTAADGEAPSVAFLQVDGCPSRKNFSAWVDGEAPSSESAEKKGRPERRVG